MIAFADDVLAYVREQHFSVGNDARITVGVDLCVICNQTLDVCLVLDSAKIAPLHFFALIITGCLSESHTSMFCKTSITRPLSSKGKRRRRIEPVGTGSGTRFSILLHTSTLGAE